MSDGPPPMTGRRWCRRPPPLLSLRGPKGRGSPEVERPQALEAGLATPGLLRLMPFASSPRNDGVGAAVSGRPGSGRVPHRRREATEGLPYAGTHR